ncbi:MAG: DNA-directed RNA polymerase subunit omega [Clostridia bacterium]|nr:DNA-directed RNA polymerase subunit omega [Clostridia bacterium]
MINVPAVDTLIERLGEDGQPASRYELCVVVAKRARQLIERNAVNNANENPGKLKEIALACEEIDDGKIKSVKD